MTDSPGSRQKALTYSSYLEVDRLLDLQRPLSPGPEHDEMLFIVIHQVYELWFKEVNHEVGHLQRRLEKGERSDALSTFRRILTILKTLVAQVDVLETMTPVSFGSFRDRLESASGFQSAGFREMEFRLGKKSQKLLTHHPQGTPGRARLDEVYGQPGLYDSFLRFLSREYPIPGELLTRDPGAPNPASEQVREILLDIYRNDHSTRSICERMVDLDEGLQEWRYRHVKMVERTIGFKSGTGGSAGAAYLRDTLFKPLFPDLWEIRSRL